MQATPDDNFGKFIHQFQPETKSLIRKLKRILIKLYRQNVSLLFNQTCLNERLLPNYTYTHIYMIKYDRYFISAYSIFDPLKPSYKLFDAWMEWV